MTHDDAVQGAEIVRALLGPERYDQSRVRTPETHQRDLLRLADEVIFGKTYAREGLELAERSLCTIAALAVLGRTAQLRGHLAVALELGVAPAKLTEVIRQMAFYGGVPAALNAMVLADACIGEHQPGPTVSSRS